LREDDKILWTSYLWQSAQSFDRNMEITVERGDDTIEFQYWPRAFEKARSWQLFKVAEN
jgi:hypothetical protein